MMRDEAVSLLWLITRPDGGRINVLTINLADGAETLPVFSFREEAEIFLRLGETLSAGWRARQTAAGELISVLYGPCAGVKKMALDPLPAADEHMMTNLVSLGRERFVRRLMGNAGLRLRTRACSGHRRPRVPVLWKA